MKRAINRAYVVGVIIGMVNSGVGAHIYNKGKLGNWWNMLLLLLGINLAIVIGAGISQMVAEKILSEDE